MQKQLFLITAIGLVLCFIGTKTSAQPTTPPAPTATTTAAPVESGDTSRARELAEQLRRSRSAQQNRNRTQGDRRGLLAMNLTGLETFGDALGGISDASDAFFVTETFTFNSGMFVSSSAVSNGQFTGWLTSLNRGPAIGFSQSVDTLTPSGNTVLLTNLPSGLAADVVAYLGGGGGGFDVTVSPGLAEYAASHGIDPAQLTLDTANSYVAFDWPGGYAHTADFRAGQIVYNYAAEYKIPISPGGTYGLGRQKVTENMTPVPTDRFIFDYSYFHNVPLAYRNMPVNRYTPGFEKTFLNKRFSLEMRFPFAATIDNKLYTNNENQLNVLRWGDATAIVKYLVYQGERLAMTMGLGVSLPFASDTHMIDAMTGREVIRSQHQSVHLMPYVGFLYIPNDRVFLQGYFQVDAAANGDPTYVGDLADTEGNRMLFAGKTYERTYAYTSLAAGYWLFRQFGSQGAMKRGMNLMGELHWTQSLDQASGVQYEQGNFSFDIGSDRGNYTVLDLTLGTRYLVNEKTNVGIGYSVPLSAGHQFDGELRIAFNRYF